MEIHPISDFTIEKHYDSPIKLTFMDDCINRIMEDTESTVLRAVLRTGIDIDKDSLIQALEADKKRYMDAYERGYRNGYNKCYEDMTLTKDEWSGIR